MRTIVRSSTPGWYIDAQSPVGKRVRRLPSDRIISEEEYINQIYQSVTGQLLTRSSP